MRDGCLLLADVYRPDDAERHPLLLVRTPYDRTYAAGIVGTVDAIRLAEKGYAVVVQDVRGRFGSGGEFEAYEAEAEDGYDSVEWAAALPYSDGNVGMYGTSYLAQVQYLAASLQPPALRAITPTESPHSTTGGDRYRGGAMALGVLAYWAIQAIAPAEVVRRAGQDPALWGEFVGIVDDIDHLDEHMERLPLVPWPPIDERAGGLSRQFDATVRYEYHPPQPRFQASDIAVPAFVIAGWNDLFLQPNLDLFSALKQQAATEEARRLTRLMVGPWAHGSLASTVGEVDYGFRASPYLLDMREDITKLHRRWLDQRLRGKATGIDDEAPVRIFVMGRNRWQDETAWPPARAAAEAWHIQAGGGLARKPPGGSEPSEFRLDPVNPVRTWGGGLLMAPKYQKGPVDQARVESHPDVLVFTSDALEAPLEVIGRVTLEAWVAAETPDTDVVARLCDVHPNGRSNNVVDGILRLRFREGLDREVALVPGEVYQVSVDLWSTAYVFLPGHRLRLQVCASDFPRYDRCPGSGETSATATRILPQRNRLFHDPARPSRLLLPVIPG